MATVAEVPSMLSLWRKVRQLYPVYAAIASCFQFPAPPVADIAEIDSGGDDAVLHLAGWIEEIDNLSQPHHLRTVLQELDVASSDLCLSMWLHHFISKPMRGAADRDKIDFLLSHYLRMNLPPSLQEGRPNHAAMKAVLEPVLGSCDAALPEETREVEELIGIAERCRSLGEFEQSGIIRRGRELKLRAGDAYFTPPFLLAFTHFNAVVRRECSRLMNSDLKFIGDALERLERQGVAHVDCTAANWSDHEPLSDLKNRWATWEMANSDYSTDFFATLIGFRNAMEEALDHSIELSMMSVSDELRSIHSLLKEMRKQIDELPRKLSSVAQPAAAQANPGVTSTPPKRPAAQSATASAQLLTTSPPTVPQPVVAKPAPEPVPAQSLAPQAVKNTPAPAVAKVIPIAPQENLNPVPAPVVLPMPGTGATAPAVAVVAVAPKPTPAEPIIAPVTDTASVTEFAVCAPVDAAIEEVAPVKQVEAAPLAFEVTAPEAKEPVNAPVVVAPAIVPPIPSQPTVKSAAAPQPPPAQPLPLPPTMAAVTDPKVETGAANPATTPAEIPATDTASSAKAGLDLDAGIARLQKTLTGKRPAAVSIAVAGTRVLLTGAEAGMFAASDDNKFAKAVQRAVMMRICLVSAMETYSKTRDKASVTMLVSTARGEQSSMRDLINECKSRKLAREEEILSATAKQLSAMLERAERIAR